MKKMKENENDDEGEEAESFMIPAWILSSAPGEKGPCPYWFNVYPADSLNYLPIYTDLDPMIGCGSCGGVQIQSKFSLRKQLIGCRRPSAAFQNL